MKASTTKKHLPHADHWVHFAHRDTMRTRHDHPKAELPESVPATTLPVDCTGNAKVSCPMDLNDSEGCCMVATGCHVDNIWTFGRGETGWVESNFALAAIKKQYEAASGGDNGLDEPTLLSQCWKPGLAGVAAATYDDSLNVNVNNVALAQFCIDHFFHVCMMRSVPDAFLNEFKPGGVWAASATPDPENGHGTPITDIAAPGTMVNGVDIGGFYRLYTWGAWVWVSPTFVKSVDPECFVVLSRRQFNAQGYDAHRRHVSDVTKAWISIGGSAAKAAALVAMFPAIGPAPTPAPAEVSLAQAQAWADAGLAKHFYLMTKATAQAAVAESLAANWPK